jgi:hypothetical protein
VALHRKDVTGLRVGAVSNISDDFRMTF